MTHVIDTKKIKSKAQKTKELEKGLGITAADKNKIAVDYVIDTNKRTKMGAEPKMVD